MELFKKRNTPIQNIAYMAIMSAINVIFVLLSNVLPFLLFLLVFLLPLTSTIVTIYCKKKYYPIYAVVTFALCILVSYGFSVFDTLIYVFPSLIVGFFFGICFEYQLPAIFVLVGNTIVEFFLSILTFYVLGSIITNLNMMDTLITAFGLKDFAYQISFSFIFLFIISQIQIVLSYIFIKTQLNRLGFIFNLDSQFNYFLYFLTVLLFALSLTSYFYFPNWCLVFSLMPLMIYVFETITLLMKNKVINYVLIGSSLLGFVLLFAGLYSYLNSPNQLIIIHFLFVSTTIIDFLNNYCFKKNINNIK